MTQLQPNFPFLSRNTDRIRETDVKGDDANCEKKNPFKFILFFYSQWVRVCHDIPRTVSRELRTWQPCLITVICDNHLPPFSAFQTLPEGRRAVNFAFAFPMVNSGHDRLHPTTHTNTNKTQIRTRCRGQKGFAASKQSALWKSSDLFNSHGEYLQAFST